MGGILTIGTLWGLTDFFLAVCMFICLFTLFQCRNIVAEKTREYVSGAQEE
jgi:alanine or glycine:cation symporter, AGCS family